MAEISGGVYVLLPIFTTASLLGPATTSYGTRSASGRTSSYLRPMNRLIEKIVFLGLVIACRFATCPTRRSPSFVKATTEGVVREPSALGMTTGSPPSITATTEFVVPRSIPMTLPMWPHLSENDKMTHDPGMQESSERGARAMPVPRAVIMAVGDTLQPSPIQVVSQRAIRSRTRKGRQHPQGSRADRL